MNCKYSFPLPKVLMVMVAVCLGYSLALKCYQCAECGSNNGEEKVCPSGLNTCVKGDIDGKIYRSCAVGGKNGCGEEKEGKRIAQICYCNSDLCNSGATLSPLVITIIAIASFPIYLYNTQ
jgi:hypothetical protein